MGFYDDTHGEDHSACENEIDSLEDIIDLLQSRIRDLETELASETETHCDPCLNGPAEGKCGRERA